MMTNPRHEDRFIIRDIREKFLWGIWTRYSIVITSSILLLTQFSNQVVFNRFIFLLGCLLAYNLLAHLSSTIRVQNKVWQMITIASLFNVFDVFALTSLIYLTGGVESPFWFLYLVLIVVSGFGLYSSYSLVVFVIALFSIVSYVGLLFTTYFGVFPKTAQDLVFSRHQLLLLVTNRTIFTSISFILFAATIYYFAKMLSENREDLAVKHEQLLSTMLKIKEVDRMKDEFIANASHELRTPLAVVRENISLVSEGIVGEVSQKQKTLLVSSQENVDRLAKILDSLLDISKIESRSLRVNLKKIDICLIGKDAINMLQKKAAAKNVAIETACPEQLMVWADPDQLLRVFVNLIDNAVKYSEENGRVRIGVDEDRDFIKIHIKDSGIGIAQKDKPHVFERFTRFRDNIKGSGLGLSICKGIIEMHKGTLWVESEPGKGSTFYFTLRKV